MKPDNKFHEDVWEFGDVWKQGSPDDPVSGDAEYVEIFRGDTGRGYDDSFFMDLIVSVGAQGIRATFDAFGLGMEPAAIKTYVFKVEAGKVNEAIDYLKKNKYI